MGKSTLCNPDNPSYDPVFTELKDIYFPNLLISILSLVQFVTVDSAGGISHPLLLLHVVPHDREYNAHELGRYGRSRYPRVLRWPAQGGHQGRANRAGSDP